MSGIDVFTQSCRLQKALSVLPRLAQAPALQLSGGDGRARFGGLARVLQEDYDSAEIAHSSALIAFATEAVDHGLPLAAPRWSPGLGMAQLYLSRERWLKPALLSSLLLVGSVATWQFVGEIRESKQRATQAREMAQQQLIEQQTATDRRSAQALLAELQGLNIPETVQQPVKALQDQAAAQLAEGSYPLLPGLRRLQQAVQGWLQVGQAPVDTDGLPDLVARQRQQRAAAMQVGDLAAAQRALAAESTAVQLEDRLSRRRQPAGMDEAAQTALAQSRAITDQALLTGELTALHAALDAEEALADRIAQAYSLRIVDRPGSRSGVWRHPEGDSSVRNYYLVVEAIDGNGQVLTLPVENQETQRVLRVSQHALRVSEAEYNRVGEEKRTRGLISEPLIGRKVSGRLNPEFSIAVAGGAITEW